MRQIAFRGRPASWWASVAAVLSVTATVMAAPPAALAQSQHRPPTLSTLFEDIFGPRGLVLNSDDVQLDGTNHAAHFNSAFQSEFRLMNVALTSQLATVPLPSPASGFTYHFDPADRHVRSLDAQLRPDPGRARRDHRPRQDRVRLHVSVLLLRPPRRRADHGHPGGIHPRQSAGRRRPRRRRGDGNTIEATVAQFTGALTYGVTDRIDLSLAVPVVRTRLSLLSNATIHRIGTGSDLGVHYFRDPDAIGGYGSTRQFFSEDSAAGIGDLVARAKATVMREGSRALAVGLDVRMPTGDEQNLLGSGAVGMKPFAAFSTSMGAFAPHANVAYQWNGESLIAGNVRENQKADLPDQFTYAFGADVLVAPRLSVIVDLFGQRVIRLPAAWYRPRPFAPASPAASRWTTSSSSTSRTGAPPAASG